jgi:nucleoside-diphosphate-sugar epimerase
VNVPLEKKNGIVSLVTGGTSGLGNAIIRRLLAEGDEVRVVLRNMPSQLSELKTLPPGSIPYIADITLKRKDDKANLNAAAKGVDRVFHIGGATYNSRFSYDELLEINVIGTENILQAIVEANPPTRKINFLYASSVGVYGYRRKEEIIKESAVPKPGSHYSESKVMAEHLIESFSESHPNLKYTIFRLGTLYGPGYEEPYFFKAFRLIKEGKMRYIGNGNNHLALLHMDDAADAFTIVANKPGTAKNTIYNLTDGEPHTPRELFTFAAKAMGVKPPNKSVPTPVARLLSKTANITYDEYEFMASDRIIDISKLKKETGFSPRMNIEVEGLLMIQNFLAKEASRKAKQKNA